MAAKKCLICNCGFSGRRDAKTCSPRCRKRLQLVRLTFIPARATRQMSRTAPLFLLGLLGVFSLLLGTWTAPATAATSDNLNFQARLLTSTGAVVADGNYHIEFKIYDSASSGASAQGVCSLNSSTDDCWWLETRTTGNLVRVVNGYFNVNLGSVTAFGANIPWDQPLWLTMNIGGSGGAASWDGEMLASSSRIKLTGVPYAFRAGSLAKNNGTQTGTLSFNTVANSPVITLPDASGTLCIQGSSSCNFINNSTNLQTGATFNIQSGTSGALAGIITGAAGQSVDIFQIKADGVSNALFGIGNTGSATFRNSTNSTTAFRIQNSGGSSILSADSTKGIVLQSFTQVSYLGGADSTSTTNSGTGVINATSTFVVGKYLYATYNSSADCSSSDKSGCELKIFDITNPGSPTFIGGADTNGRPQTSTGGGSSAFNSVAVVGKYAYIAKSANGTACTASTANSGAIGCELQVYDISNPYSPTYLGGADASGSANSGTGNVSFNDIDVLGRYAYIVTSGNSSAACSQTAGSAVGCEFKIFDISNPGQPTYVGGADASGATNAETNSVDFLGINVSSRYAYVAKGSNATACTSSTSGTGAMGCELQIYDISNPASPTMIASRDTDGSTTGIGASALHDLYAAGRYLYIVKNTSASGCSASVGSATGCELQIYDVINPSAPTYVGGVDASGTTNTGSIGSAFESIQVRGRYLYIGKAGDDTACSATAGSAVGCELQVYDATNPIAPVYMGGADATGTTNGGAGSGTPTQSSVSELYVSGRYAYIAKNSSATDCSATAGSAIGCEIQTYDISGTETSSLLAHSLEAGSLQVQDNLSVYNNLSVQGGLSVGQNIELNGDLGVSGKANFWGISNSSDAFQIQNAVGSSALVIDTTSVSSIIANQSFERDTNGWAYSGTPGSIARTTSERYIGNASLSVTTTANADNGVRFTTSNTSPTQLAISTTYTLSWYAKRDGTAFTDIIAAYARNGSAETNCTGINTQTVSSSGWTRFTCTITTDGSAPNINAYLVIKQVGATARTFYIDGVQLEVAGSATSYKETGISLNGLINSPTTFRNQSESVTAFQIQNSSSSNLFSVDTLNNSILVRSPTDSSSAFQIQNSAGTALFLVNSSSSIITFSGTTSTFVTVTLSEAHFKSSQTTKPTIGTPTNCGTSPTAAVTGTAPSDNSTDSAGSFTITSGATGTPTTCDTVLTFNKAYGAAPKSIIVRNTTAVGSGTGIQDVYVSASSTTTFTVKFTANNAANGIVYAYYYWVVE